MNLFCEALIDQDCYVGNDPVGFGCGNPAKWRAPLGDGVDILLCDRCKALLGESPERLTLRGRTPAARDDLYKRLVAEMKRGEEIATTHTCARED